jgi:hypothetical protein
LEWLLQEIKNNKNPRRGVGEQTAQGWSKCGGSLADCWIPIPALDVRT